MNRNAGRALAGISRTGAMLATGCAPTVTGNWFTDAVSAPFVWAFANKPAEESDIYAEKLAETAKEHTPLYCNEWSDEYDKELCEHLRNPDIVAPQTRADIERDIDALHCDSLDLLCLWGLRNRDKTWKSFMAWPLAAKVVAGVVAAGTAGFVVGSLRRVFGKAA